jgi:DNA helicase IV
MLAFAAAGARGCSRTATDTGGRCEARREFWLSYEDRDLEQAYISMLYRRLDELRDRASGRLAGVLRQAGGTHQARTERDAFSALYSQQIAQFDAAENGLCFGRLDFRGGERRYLGRIGMHADSEDYEQLLMDWRASAARPFYLATAVAPENVTLRRHIETSGRIVTGLDDEVLDLAVADPNRREGLTGESALLAAMAASRTGRMSDIVATIQAEQDHIIRSALPGVLVVQGGPGTGKTAVALHRAAYLLYTHRRQLLKRGVLVVGPNATFLRYIGQVLPSLGETSVLLSTMAGLYPGITATAAEPAETAILKGDPRMARVIAAAVRDRQQVPDGGLEVTFEGDTYVVSKQECAKARERARRSRRPHNQARHVFVREMLGALTRQVAGRLGANVLGEANLLDDDDVADLRQELRADPGVRVAIDRLWPVLTAQRLLAELFASPRRLAAAAPGLTPAELALLRRDRAPGRSGRVWTPADVPLLDEAAELLGEDDLAARRRAERERRGRVGYAQGVLDIMSRDDDADPEILMGADLVDASRLAARQEEEEHLTAADRAAADRAWTFGHVIVDEAQELSGMAWRLLMRRCPARSMTIVGDVAQTGDLAGAASWAQVLRPHLGDRWRLAGLTINYRAPAEIMAVAADVLAAIGPDLELPRSVRESGTAPWRLQTAASEFADQVAAATARAAAQAGDGRLAVIVPAARLAELRAAVEGSTAGDSTAAGSNGAVGDGAGGGAGGNAAGGGPAMGGAGEGGGAGGNAAGGGPAMGEAGEGGGAGGNAAGGGADMGGNAVAGNGAGSAGEGGAAGGAGGNAARGGAAMGGAADSAADSTAGGEDPDLERPVVVLTVRQAKGLEFDDVLIADPGQILAESPRGLNDLYVALTRATQRLGVVHPGPPPGVLAALKPISSIAEIG